MIRRVGVVVPARDEEARLGACLDAIADARSDLMAARRDVEVDVVVVLDRCQDGSGAVVAARPDVSVLVVDAGVVGVARDRGVRHHLDRARANGVPPSHLWLAHTDADSLVPRDWLTVHLTLAEFGADAVVGQVQVDLRDRPATVAVRYWATYEVREGHPHVHGANLGCTGAAYESVGGFPPVAEHEDVALVRALRGAHRVHATPAAAVRTSARRDGRTPGGFAGHLRSLEAS